MQTLLTYLKLFPAILAAVRALEEAIPIPAAGRQKLNLLLAMVKTAYDGEEAIRKEVPWDKIARIISDAVKTVVETFNTLGLFRHSAETRP